MAGTEYHYADGAITITGLKQLEERLRAIADDLPDELVKIGNEAAEQVVTIAKGRVPRLRGNARRSLQADSTATEARVQGGGFRAPYYGWLEFGGRVGPGGNVDRPYIRQGRYVFPAFESQRGKIEDDMRSRLAKLVGDL